MADIADEHYDAIMDSELGFYTRGASGARCALCGKYFRWAERFVVGEWVWRLVASDGTIHICSRTASVDEFPEVR